MRLDDATIARMPIVAKIKNILRQQSPLDSRHLHGLANGEYPPPVFRGKPSQTATVKPYIFAADIKTDKQNRQGKFDDSFINFPLRRVQVADDGKQANGY